MRAYIYLLLVFAVETLAQSKYTKDTNALLKDSILVSADPDVSGQIKKNLIVKPFDNIIDILGLHDRSSKGKKLGLNINGGLELPKLSIDKNDGGIGLSLDSGLNLGIDKSYEKRGDSHEHMGHHERQGFNSHELWEEIWRQRGGNRHRNWHRGSHENHSHEKGLIFYLDGDKSGSVSGSESYMYQNNHGRKKKGAGIHARGAAGRESEIIISHGDSWQNFPWQINEQHSGRHQNNYGVKKESSAHVGGRGTVIISGNDWQSSKNKDYKGKNNHGKKKGAGIHARGAAGRESEITISHGDSWQNFPWQISEQHSGRHQSNYGVKKEGSAHVGGGTVIISGNDWQSSKGKDYKGKNNHGKKKGADIHARGAAGRESEITISHGDSWQNFPWQISERHSGRHQSNHGVKKEDSAHIGGARGTIIFSGNDWQFSKGKDHNDKNNHDEENEDSIHAGGGGQVIISHGNSWQSSRNDKEYNGKHQNNHVVKKEGTGNIYIGGGGGRGGEGRGRGGKIIISHDRQPNGQKEDNTHVGGEGKIIVSHSSSSQSNNNDKNDHGKHQSNHIGKKEGTGRIHIGERGGGAAGGGKITTSHDNDGQSSGHQNNHSGKKKDSIHVGGGGKIIISYGNNSQSNNNDKDDHRKHQSNHVGKKKGTGSIHIGGGAGGGKINISHGSGGKFSSKDKNHNRKHQNNHDGKKEGSIHIGGGGGKVTISHEQSNSNEQSNDNDQGDNGKGNKKEGNIVILLEKHQSSHNASKGHQESSKKSGTKKGGKDGRLKKVTNSHAGGVINITLDNHNGKVKGDGKKHNSGGSGINTSHGKEGSIAHGKNNATIKWNHGSQNENSGHGNMIIIDGKGSGSHDKDDRHSNSCSLTLGDGKCGSDVKKTLIFIQTLIRACNIIVHFLMEMKKVELRNTLCHISPHNSKLSCQLGCNILRASPL